MTNCLLLPPSALCHFESTCVLGCRTSR